MNQQKRIPPIKMPIKTKKLYLIGARFNYKNVENTTWGEPRLHTWDVPDHRIRQRTLVNTAWILISLELKLTLTKNNAWDLPDHGIR